MREEAGAGGGEREDVEAVGQQVLVAEGGAVGPVVVDRVVVAGEKLEGGEVRIGQRARGTWETLADFELVEGAMRDERAGERVEGLGHALPSRAADRVIRIWTTPSHR